MPNDTIERGIKKAAGDLGSVNYETATYEGYGPGGIAIIVETLTDNPQPYRCQRAQRLYKGRRLCRRYGMCILYVRFQGSDHCG